jgi:hypothetical protein
MTTSLRSLTQVAPPPSIPIETGSPSEWPRIEEELGFNLPLDYRDFIHAYGTGCFQGFLWILNPFSEDEHLNLLRQAPMLLWTVGEVKRQSPDAVPWPLFPEPGGLLPWARSDRGDALYWLTEGVPEAWPVVVWQSRPTTFVRVDRSTTMFLFQWLSGLLDVDLAPDAPPPAGTPAFQSATERGRTAD